VNQASRVIKALSATSSGILGTGAHRRQFYACCRVQQDSVIVLLALIPMGTAVLIYFFIGSFIGGHIQLTAAVAAILGVLQYPPSLPDIRGPTRG
jgi:hypothetical protein